MNKENKKKSILIQPIIALIDVSIINISVYFVSNKDYFTPSFLLYLTLFWVLISYYTRFYSIYRYTHITKILTRLLSQFFVFTLAFFAYFTLFKEGQIIHRQTIILLVIATSITFFKFLIFFLLRSYRLNGKNFRNVIVFGESKSAQNVVSLFSKKHDLGYNFSGFFSDKESKSKKHLGSIKEGFEFAKNNNIDEVYCEVSSINTVQLKKIREFCSKNNIEVRLIPENKAIYSKDFILEYYGTIPILKPKPLPFERIETHFIKRIFDVIFSFCVCIFILSWLMPILWIIVKTNSKGPFLFKQLRDGIHGNQFYCYKIRSMEVNSLADKISTIKNDKRVTSVGKVLRKTSLDELPQFFNVLFGDMSVIGPRPHMNIQTEKYLKEIDNYLTRNSIKPGITGLAQVSGYRGEIEKKSDIENRVRLDIFYIENWSFFLDVKIIFLTLINIFRGQEKAY